ncbi:KdsC family phosphatase [Stygiobacter electus]|uniref:HAD hydrolase family protein n=1 Tax=Stygiobacter electus TaxID=3032292 RepID=A0AAE3TDN1_9BACT|nr:HAD hydrolase family protein [Stygiobacter electus]MDF1612721.1 HAD hydrolase family protein [Stygiobacter electus]
MKSKKLSEKEIYKRASKIKLLLTDVDGVLTDTGVYYSANGEELKRFSIRDGMGVERLRTIVDVETGIVTRENTNIVSTRAKKLKIEELHLGVIEKENILNEILERKKLKSSEVAFIGDDTNDIGIIKKVGLSACPNDAMQHVKKICDIILDNKGGNGAFREFAELIIESKLKKNNKKGKNESKS